MGVTHINESSYRWPPPVPRRRRLLEKYWLILILYDRHEIFSKFASFVPILKHTNWAPKQNMYEKDLQNLGGWGAYFRIKIWAGLGQIFGLGQVALLLQWCAGTPTK